MRAVLLEVPEAMLAERAADCAPTMRHFLAGEKSEDIASDYDLTEDEVLAAIRVLSGHRDAA